MRVSMFADLWSATVPDLIEEATFAGEAGVDTYWIAQIWRMDSMTLIPSLAAAAGPDLKFGSGIVSSYLRHPVTMASRR
jgi:alkanesulfonate monooxygenase SsuD/methylene tetrahydromethanopterin reductase-like flavin-dependent oxidoreductase (luciferase family)